MKERRSPIYSGHALRLYGPEWVYEGADCRSPIYSGHALRRSKGLAPLKKSPS